MLVVELGDRGLTQEAAANLGVTGTAVSTYVDGWVTHPPRIRDDPRPGETVDRIADRIAAGEMDGSEALAELLALIREREDRGPIWAPRGGDAGPPGAPL